MKFLREHAEREIKEVLHEEFQELQKDIVYKTALLRKQLTVGSLLKKETGFRLRRRSSFLQSLFERLSRVLNVLPK